jgi:Protein of unknown function (DUF3800)
MSSAQNVWELSRAVLGDQDGYVAVLKVYLDESGTHDESPVVTVGAYLARPKEWKKWTASWNVAKKPIKVFHANDCANLWGEFEGWDKESRDAFVAKLLPVIANHKMVGLLIGINMVAYKKAMKEHPELLEMVGTPYAACFQWVIQTILNNVEKKSSNEQIAFFHEINDYKEEALKAFDFVRDNRRSHSSNMTLAFGSKEKYVPLQAADILAYEGNKRLRNPYGPKRRALIALDPNNTRLSIKHYGEKNMNIFISKLSNFRLIGGELMSWGVLPF